MRRSARILLLDAATVMSLVLCAGAMWVASPDRTTTRWQVLVATEESFNREMSRDLVRVTRVPDRPGQYVVEEPSENYGQLFVELPFGRRVALGTALIALAALPAARLAYWGVRCIARYRLYRWIPAASLAACACLLAWRLIGTPFTYRDSSVVGNLLILRGKPPPLSWYETHETWSPLWAAVALTLLPPVGWAIVAAYRLWGRAPDPTLCRCCGYDLRATPDRCPECGTVPTSEGRAPAPEGGRR